MRKRKGHNVKKDGEQKRIVRRISKQTSHKIASQAAFLPNIHTRSQLPSRLALYSPHLYAIRTPTKNEKVRVQRLFLQRQGLNTFPKLGLIYTTCYAHLQSEPIAPDALFSLEGGRSCLICILGRRWHDFCMWNTEKRQKDYFCWKVFDDIRTAAFHSFFCGTCSSVLPPILLFGRTL